MRYVKTARLNLRLYDDDKEALKWLAEKFGINMTDTVIKLIREKYQQEQKKEN